MHAVVVSFDRLPAHLVGCYGNEWIETPGFDALAARSAVFERHLVELPGAAGANSPWWTGRFEFFSAGRRSSLLELLDRHGVTCRLVTERAEGLPDVDVEDLEYVSGEDGLDVAHADVPFAQLVQRGQERIAGFSSDRSELLWLHSAGVPSPWLPPEFFAGLYLDELEDRLDGPGDELASRVIAQLRDDPVMRDLLLSEPDDDEADDEHDIAGMLKAEFGEAGVAISRFVFAGYVSLIDHWLQKLTATLSDCPHDVLLIVTAAGGYSFGEERGLLEDVGVTQPDSVDDQFGDQTLQTPLLIWRRSHEASGTRVRSLVQPPEIPATLADWFEVPATSDWCDGLSLLDRTGSGFVAGRDATVHLSDSGAIGFQDGDWFLAGRRDEIESMTDELDTMALQLYRKPDDFWETHDLASQSPDECQRLIERLQERLAVRESF